MACVEAKNVIYLQEDSWTTCSAVPLHCSTLYSVYSVVRLFCSKVHSVVMLCHTVVYGTQYHMLSILQYCCTLIADMLS